MTEESLQSVTTETRWLLMGGIAIIVGLTALLFWRQSHSVPVGEVVIAPPLTVAEAQQKLWFTVPELAPREGWEQEGVHLVGENWAVIRYTANDGSIEVGKGTKRPLLRSARPFPREVRKTTTVNGHLAIFIQGGWDDAGQWNTNLDSAMLEWSGSGFHYRIQHTGLGLNYQQMIDFGTSLTTVPEKAAASNAVPVSTAVEPS